MIGLLKTSEGRVVEVSGIVLGSVGSVVVAEFVVGAG
jgi:hypothetical protein